MPFRRHEDQESRINQYRNRTAFTTRCRHFDSRQAPAAAALILGWRTKQHFFLPGRREGVEGICTIKH